MPKWVQCKHASRLKLCVCVWIAKTHRAGSFTVSSNIIYLQHLWQLFRKFGTPLLLATCARTSTSCWVWLLCLPVRAPDEGPPTFHKRSLHIKSHIKSDFLWLCDCPAAHCLVCPQIWIAQSDWHRRSLSKVTRAATVLWWRRPGAVETVKIYLSNWNWNNWNVESIPMHLHG